MIESKYESLFNQAQSASENDLKITKEHFLKTVEGIHHLPYCGVKLQSLRSVGLILGGLKMLCVSRNVEWPTKYAPILQIVHSRLRSGILLYGYPGCGKTLPKLVIVGQCGLNFISIIS